ncbi:hypothetical protein V6N11_007566 [Hibiscus sabdariffa]|uniref:Uncharacterized protein n=2 Tax=Hibiscus sabdariffa TaxID=183260 RepID=A0ABR2CBI5_9ROSI
MGIGTDGVFLSFRSSDRGFCSRWWESRSRPPQGRRMVRLETPSPGDRNPVRCRQDLDRWLVTSDQYKVRDKRSDGLVLYGRWSSDGSVKLKCFGKWHSVGSVAFRWLEIWKRETGLDKLGKGCCHARDVAHDLGKESNHQSGAHGINKLQGLYGISHVDGRLNINEQTRKEKALSLVCGVETEMLTVDYDEIKNEGQGFVQDRTNTLGKERRQKHSRWPLTLLQQL